MKCLLAILPRPHGQPAYAAAYAAGAPGGTLLPTRVLSNSSMLQLLGIGEASADLLLSVVPDESVETIVAALQAYVAGARLKAHLLLSVPVCTFSRAAGAAAEPSIQETAMPAETAPAPYQLIVAIVNKGYAEDAMAAARGVGAMGGTVLAARGTAKPGDAEFFGVPLVPEKDQLLMLAPTADAPAILSALQALPCFAEKGAGVVFTLPATSFAPLGR